MLFDKQSNRNRGVVLDDKQPRLRKKWMPEEVEAMRRELLDGGKTLQEIAEREGLTRQRVQQIVGRLDRHGSWKRAAAAQPYRDQIAELTRAGMSDEAMAAQTGIKPERIKTYRLEAGIKRPDPRKRHTVVSTIRYAQLWFDEYGYSPCVADWNSAQSSHTDERAQRLKEFSQKHGKPPVYTTVHSLLGSHTELLRQAGLPRVLHGYPARSSFGSPSSQPAGGD